MTKIELEEILKIIDIEIAKAHKELCEAVHDKQQYYIGKKHALQDIKPQIRYQHRNALEVHG